MAIRQKDRVPPSSHSPEFDDELLRLAVMYHPHTLTKFCVGAILAGDFKFVQKVYETLGGQYPKSVVPLYGLLIEGIRGIDREQELLS